MKSILILVEYFPPRLGADRRIFEMARRLSNVYRVCFVVLPPSYVSFIRCISKPPTSNMMTIENGMKAFHIGLPMLLWKSWKTSMILGFLLTVPYLILTTIKQAIKQKTDFIIANNTSIYTGLVAWVSGLLLRKRLIVDFNDLESAYSVELLQGRVNEWVLKFMWCVAFLVEKTMVKTGWRITTHTKFLKDYAFKVYQRRGVAVIPDGVDTTLFDPHAYPREKIRQKYQIGDRLLCVYAGRLDYAAGGEFLLKTIEILTANPQVVFLLVGEGSNELLSALGRQKNVIFQHRIPQHEVPYYLAAADVVLVPFPQSLASRSLSPLKLFEALAMEKYVVATDLDGIREITEEGAHVSLISAEPQRWASHLAMLACDPPDTFELNRKIILEKYDWQILSSKYQEVLRA